MITYYEFVRSTNKGESSVGDLIVSPFKNGKVDPNYTSKTVVENATLADSKLNLRFGPAVPGTIEFTIGNDKYFDDGAGKLYKGIFASKVFSFEKTDANGRLEGQAGRFIVDKGSAVEAGTVTYGFAGSKQVVGPIYDNSAKPVITFTTTPSTEDPITVNYVYNNIAIVQDELPYITMVEKGIHVVAEARRIAIEWSQMAAFKYRKEYKEDLGAKLEQVAMHNLKMEIDVDGTNQLVKAAGEVQEDLTFNITPRTGVSLSQHCEGLSKVLNDGRKKVFATTQKFLPNWMLAGYDFISILPFVKDFKDSGNLDNANGPFYFGTVNGMKVYITPNMDSKQFVLGVKGNDLGTTAAVFAPFMAVAPTALLETPDGANTKGFSTVYAFEIVNKDLLIKGAITEDPQSIVVTAPNA